MIRGVVEALEEQHRVYWLSSSSIIEKSPTIASTSVFILAALALIRSTKFCPMSIAVTW